MSRKIKNRFLPLLLSITLAVTSTLIYAPTVNAATTLEVPSPAYPTIQSALNAAKDGDTIKIAAGTYNQNINYDGYAQAVAAGSSQPKSGVTLQGSEGTVINGAISLFYLKNFKISSLTVAGDLTLGDGRAYGYVTGSIVSDVQVGSILSIGGTGNMIVDSQIKMVILKGGNTKTEFPAYNTVVENNQLRGVTIQSGSYGNTIKANIISHGQTGIVEEPSKTYHPTGGNQIINNTIANNEVGVSLYSSTGDNGAASHTADQLIQNIIRANTVGLQLSASNQYIVGNTLYHNDFIENSVQVKISNPVSNVWDDGAKKGNYWSDYTGKDGNGDRVGDTAYNIDAQNQDNYPLMKPYSAPASLTSVAPSPSPSQSPVQPSNPSTILAPSESPLPVAPEFAPFAVVVGLVAVSVLALAFLKRRAATL
ncbi:MAG: nitrous oxide reductase family maturation protein NosD [Candidatus Bathyarchaeia archaeon]|jgi:hypothetical protein